MIAEHKGVLEKLAAIGHFLERFALHEFVFAAVDLSGALSLREMAALAARARLFFGVDSAPMHIAAAAGTAGRGLAAYRANPVPLAMVATGLRRGVAAGP